MILGSLEQSNSCSNNSVHRKFDFMELMRDRVVIDFLELIIIVFIRALQSGIYKLI